MEMLHPKDQTIPIKVTVLPLESPREGPNPKPMNLSRKELAPSKFQTVILHTLNSFTLDPTKFNYHEDWKKPPVPKKDEKPIQGLVSDKNYIVANAVENILAGIYHS